ncbi:MAG: hypothetical protein JXM69_01065 [Anaerolineae bacterium]|nr:hypothetical protein [Anaerolineae bacterium]
MSANTPQKRIYYRARDDLRINDLPVFFGWVDFAGNVLVGEHYKPKLDPSTGVYIIGYYKIEGEAANFSETFEKHGLTEITQEDFHNLLSQWTRGGVYTPQQWGLSWAWKKA